MTCDQIGKPLRRTATAGFRQCVYNPVVDKPKYWLAGATPGCPRINCGNPQSIPGANYGDLTGFQYGDSFNFGCKDEAFSMR